jgi:hypothetical protein
MITNNLCDSSKLLFSIPIHEEQDIVNNQIENILNFNPNSKIILHVNRNFKNFNYSLTKYENVYINSNSFNYVYGKGLLFIHIKNFLEMIRLGVDFKYFIIISSNEMFVKNGLESYIEEYKNGLQIEKFDKNNSWHNFHKGLENEDIIINMLKELRLDTIYGGQTEGQFYQKHVFRGISDIYLNFFGEKELNHFETEEIICQTIFKSFNLPYGKPITLQNYSSKIIFDERFIKNIVNNDIIIPNSTIKTLLHSAHINSDCTSIYCIKRVDRNFNPIRNYLSHKGFLLNKSIFQHNIYYYSNNSRLKLYNDNHISFAKNANIRNFNWFGYEIEEGYYNINFEIKTYNEITNYENIGLKMEFPYVCLYNFFFKDLKIGEWCSVSIPLHIILKQNIIFIFDQTYDLINIEIKNIQFLEVRHNKLKENIVLCLYENIESKNYDCSINYTNIYNMIIKPFIDIYNIYVFISIYDPNKVNKIANSYKPTDIILLDNNLRTINNIFIKNTENIIEYSTIFNIDFKFVIYFSIDSLFKKNIQDFNFYINKFNFISYHIPYINDKISNSYDFLSIPSKYINNFYDFISDNINNKDICYCIYSYLKDIIGKNNFNFIYDDNYSVNMRTPLIKYLNDITDVNNNKGYLFNKKYMNNIYYKNNFSQMLKNYDGEFYFNKKRSLKSEPFQWIGLHVDDLEGMQEDEITVKFDIKIMKNIDVGNYEFGLKIHEPIRYFKDWINECTLNNYKSIELKIKINKKSQFIILNFDNYLEDVEFYIKNFKISFNF